MRIAVIGAGSIGGTLALRWAALGHDLRLANSRGPESLADLVADTAVTAAPLEEVARGAEAVVISIPFGAIPDLAATVPTFPADAVLIDTGNYVPVLRDEPIAELDAGAVESLWVAAQLGRPVVKAFNTIGVASLRDRALPAGSPARVGAPVAAETPREQEVASALVDAAGFDPVPGGALADSWRQQPGTPVYTTDLAAADVPEALRRARHEDTVAWRMRMAEPRR